MDHTIQLPEILLTAPDIARILQISRAHAYRMMGRGEIPTVTFGHLRRVRPTDLYRFIELHLGSDNSQDI